MSRAPDEDDDRYDIDFSQAFPRAHRNRRHANGGKSKPRQQTAKRKFIADNFSPRKSPKEVQRDLAEMRPRASMKTLIQEMVASDLNRSTGSIVAELEEQGYEAAPITVSTIKQEIAKIIRLCRKHGSIIVPAWDD